MNTTPKAPIIKAAGNAAGRFLTGAGLPLFLGISTLIYEAFLLAVLFAPGISGSWSAFSQQFKLWCFGYNPLTGGLEWSEVILMQSEPLFILGIVLWISRKSLRTLGKAASWKRHSLPIASGFILSSIVLGGLFAGGSPNQENVEDLPFPGKRIRTNLIPPDIDLTDQKGNPFHLDDLRGEVVIMTGIYTLCGNSCPLILIELRELLEQLHPENRERAHIVAVTLNPENETPSQMDAFVSAYGFDYPKFKYLNGDPTYVRQLLKKLQFSRTVYPETGYIDHTNLFLLIDKQGEIAYRLTLDERHNAWLRAALNELTTEAAMDKNAVALK